MLNHRRDSVIPSVGGAPSFGAAYRVVVTPVGARASAASSGSTATVDAGHSFRVGDRALLRPGTDNVFTAAISAVTATAISWASATYQVSSGDRFANLGPDSGSATPAYDGSPMGIYEDADGGVAIANATVTCNAQGSYSYYHKADGRFWELILDASLVAVDVVAGHAGVMGRLNVQDFGAVGNGTYSTIGTDDTARIQAAIDASFVLGIPVYAPHGTYDTTAPLGGTFTGSPLPLMAGFHGDGWGQVDEASEGVTTIRGNGIASGRGVLEFLGVNNTHAARLKVSDLRLRAIGASSTPAGTSNAACYCLRIGDAYIPLVERVQMYGAHGMSVKISSAAGYAQILSRFSQLHIWTNWKNGFSSPDSGSTTYAVNIETGGSLWDNVSFENCLFWGQVNTRAQVCSFRSCMFLGNTDRAAGYSTGLFVGLGSVSVRDCYFEDCLYGIEAYGATAQIRNFVVDGCHFSSSSNVGATSPVAAILLTDGTYGFQAATISNNNFGATAEDFTTAEIVLNGSMTRVGTADYQNTTGLNDATASGTYSGSAPEIFEVLIDATGSPDTFTWRRLRNTAAPTTAVAITGAAQTLTDGVTITFAATTGHVIGGKWLIKAGFGGPEHVILDNNTVLARRGKTHLITKPRISFGANHLNNYMVRAHTGEVYGRQLYNRTAAFTGSEDSSTHNIGMGLTGLELVNSSGALTGGRGSESSITWRGLYESNRGKFAAITGATSTRNTTSQTDGGFLAFLTKANTDTALVERMRIFEAGAVAVGTSTLPTNAAFEVNGDIKASGGFRQTIDGWIQDNVAAGQSAVELTRDARWVAPRAGSITAISVISTEARTADTCTVEVYKNTGLSGAAGSATGLTAVLDGTNTSKKQTTQAKDTDTFAAGDELYVVVTTGGSWAPVTADIRVSIEVET